MKKSNLFLVLLMALIVMSCSKDETTKSTPQEANAIEFGTYVGRDAQTRASMINTDAQLQAKGFGVFAYYTDNTDYVKGTSTPNFMYNQSVTYSGGWTYSPVKYWPNEVTGNETYASDKVSFFAYAPYSAAPTGGNFAFAPANNAAGDPTITYTVNDAALSQEDLLWGVDGTGTSETNDNFGFPFKNQQKQTVGGNIKFQFKHALARIGFNVEALVDQVNTDGTGAADSDATTGTIAAGTQIVVTKVELIGNFYPSGTLNLNNTIANTPLWAPGTAIARTFELTPTNNFISATAYGETSYQTTGQLVTSATAKQKLNNDASYLMVIPQAFTTDPANALKIRVTYDVITEDINLNTGQSKVTNVITSTPFAFDFVGGKAYTFNLHLGMTSVKFDATVSEWGTETGIVINVPINS